MKHKSLLLLLSSMGLLASCGQPESPIKESSLEDTSSEITPVSSSVEQPFSLQNEAYIRRLGRVKEVGSGLQLDYSATGFEAKFLCNDGNKVTIEVSSNPGAHSEQYVTIYIDGVKSAPIAIGSGSQTIDLFSDLSAGEHTVKLVKNNEAMTRLTITALNVTNADPLKNEYTRKRLEVYGDSITCGYGVLGKTSDSFSTATEDATSSYGYIAAEKMGYDVSIVSQSGIALAVSDFANPSFFLDFYNAIDNSSYQSDVFIINLGTNDNTKFKKLSSAEQESAMKLFLANYKTLIDKIFKNNDHPFILGCFNMMTALDGYLETATNAAIAYANNTYGEGCADLLEFSPDYGGSDGHPGAMAHKKNGEKIASYLSAILPE